MTVVRVLFAFLPVCLFLGSLLYIDSYKLVSLKNLLRVIVYGGVAALASYVLNRQVLRGTFVDHNTLTRLVAPAIEELLKLLPVAILLYTRRIGFVIDAAICGFAAGAGFALIENLYYMTMLPDRSVAFWIVRGFGTAVMHGGTTAIAAMITKVFFQRRERESVALIVPGFIVAFAIHSVFNQFILSPLASALAVTIVLPPLLVLVFEQSERYLQGWIGSGFDLDAELLKAIRSGDFVSSRPGRYLQSLREHFDGPAVADMLCYLQLIAELSLRAKGVLMLRENGLPVARDEESRQKLTELAYLKASIGKTGQLALAPILGRSSHDLWQLRLLEEL
ncbi:MAG TPA: PrsW family glutamic-type intramembrane protease [Thermoanaerobaculia bacterium]|nr:PrsW family glutamic-type intramembrane protease [Thermoanaerobaculia bacterium]